MLVVFYHAVGMAPKEASTTIPQIGAFGVDIFFVISGFIMWTTTSHRTSAITFAWHRVARVVPIYWLLTIVLFAARYSFTWIDLLKSLLFVPYFSVKTGHINPIVVVGWTLNFEMFFYAIFTVALAVGRRGLFAFAFIVALVGIGLIADIPKTPETMVYSSPLLIEFLAGCCIGVFFERDVLGGTAVSTSILIVGLAAIVLQHSNAENFGSDRVLAWGAPAALVVAGATGLESLMHRSKPALLVGDASYSIYLIHSMVLVALKFGSDQLFPHAGMAFIIAGCLLSLSFGVTVHLFIEKPLTSAIKRLAAGGRNSKPD
jgi:exopolysaccharide production protein ExoZ